MNNSTKKIILNLFGIGKIKYAPGTFASLFTCLMYILLIIFKINFSIPLALFFILIPFSIFLINNNFHLFEKIDSSEIVIDEYIGQSIPIFFGYYYLKLSDPNLTQSILIFVVMTSFFLFRFFDILKIYPIKIIDNIQNGYGVIFDDIVAGIYSSLVLFFLLKII
jgi:phosphatidylglycerophosphatase A